MNRPIRKGSTSVDQDVAQTFLSVRDISTDRNVCATGVFSGRVFMLIDAHVHVWTDDDARYPLAPGFARLEGWPMAFPPETLLAHARPCGVERINLIQISFYGFDNSYMLDTIARFPDTFVGTAVIDVHAPDVDRTMAELEPRGIKAFRIHPRLAGRPPGEWLRPAGFATMFACAERTGQALSCLIDADGLVEVDRMCSDFPGTTVIIDHLARIGSEGEIREGDIEALCRLARHRKVYVKIGAFYALGRKAPPYDDLGGLIERTVSAFGPERCMWESDSPFQVLPPHRYGASVDLIQQRLAFLSASDREWLLGKTAASVFQW